MEKQQKNLIKNIFCPKCGVNLGRTTGVENLQFLDCYNCETSFANPHFKISHSGQKKYPTPNNSKKTTIQYFTITFSVFVVCIIIFIISNYSSNNNQNTNTKQEITNSSLDDSDLNNLNSSESYQSNISAEDEKKLREFKGKVLVLFNQLMVFKNEKDFQEVGFAVCCKYQQWLLEVKSLEETPESELFNNQYGYLINELAVLGVKYIHLEGGETEYTKWNKERLMKALDIKE